MIQKLLRFLTIILAFIHSFLWGGGNVERIEIAPISIEEESAQKNDWYDTVTLNYGQSKENIHICRFGLRKEFNYDLEVFDFVRLSGYFESSLNYWHGKYDDNYGIAFSPVFTYYFTIPDIPTIPTIPETVKPYIEGGIGVSLFLETLADGRDLSSSFLFEDRIGIGLQFKEWDFSFRYLHYSNANIEKPNNGIDIFMGSVSYRFSDHY